MVDWVELSAGLRSLLQLRIHPRFWRNHIGMAPEVFQLVELPFIAVPAGLW